MFRFGQPPSSDMLRWKCLIFAVWTLWFLKIKKMCHFFEFANCLLTLNKSWQNQSDIEKCTTGEEGSIYLPFPFLDGSFHIELPVQSPSSEGHIIFVSDGTSSKTFEVIPPFTCKGRARPPYHWTHYSSPMFFSWGIFLHWFQVYTKLGHVQIAMLIYSLSFSTCTLLFYYF